MSKSRSVLVVAYSVLTANWGSVAMTNSCRARESHALSTATNIAVVGLIADIATYTINCAIVIAVRAALNVSENIINYQLIYLLKKIEVGVSLSAAQKTNRKNERKTTKSVVRIVALHFVCSALPMFGVAILVGLKNAGTCRATSILVYYFFSSLCFKVFNGII